MDLNEAKKLVNCQGERVIFVENGDPTVVLLSYEAYKKLTVESPSSVQKSLLEISESSEAAPQEEAADELTLEDLPF